MTIRIDGDVAYVTTLREALEICDQPGLESVVIEDNMERIKFHKMMRAFRSELGDMGR